MIRKNQSILNLINVLSDMLIVFASYWIAGFIRYGLMHGIDNVHIGSARGVTTIVVYSILIGIAYYVVRLYQSQRMKKIGSALLKIYFVNGLGVMLWISNLYLLRELDFSRQMLFIFWLVSSTVVLGKHFCLRLVLHYYRKKGYNLKHVIIVGNGRMAFQYVRDIKNNPEYGFRVDGYVSGVQKDGLGQCLGRYEELENILEEYHVDSLVLALEPHEMEFMRYIMDAADKQGTRVEMIPFFNDYYPTHPTIETLGNTKLVNLRATPLDNVGWAMVKRLMDIVGSLLLIIVLSPLMLITAIGVKLSSPGPVLFKQDRIGKNKKPFRMLKFRSMRVDIDHNGWSTDEDPRKTKFGSFIRKCSIDELPQLFNVLVGQMSLIGPRPEIPYYVQQFKEDVPLYLVRQQIRPGMTGWAQVNGLRGDTSIEDRVEYDIWYIQNWSLGLDIKILWKTAFGGMINKEVI